MSFGLNQIESDMPSERNSERGVKNHNSEAAAAVSDRRGQNKQPQVESIIGKNEDKRQTKSVKFQELMISEE